MPIVELHLIKGYHDDAKRRLGELLTASVQTVVPAPPDAITVMIREVEPSGYMRGGTHRTGAPALPDPAATVREFLTAMEDRDLDRAQGFLAEDFRMTFPGDTRMQALQDLVAWSAPRYSGVRKTYTGFDVAPGLDETAVYCFGTLSGAWPDGTAFEGIRFIDRFGLRGGLIATQDVWNDIAEVRPRD